MGSSCAIFVRKTIKKGSYFFEILQIWRRAAYRQTRHASASEWRSFCFSQWFLPHEHALSSSCRHLWHNWILNRNVSLLRRVFDTFPVSPWPPRPSAVAGLWNCFCLLLLWKETTLKRVRHTPLKYKWLQIESDNKMSTPRKNWNRIHNEALYQIPNNLTGTWSNRLPATSVAPASFFCFNLQDSRH